MAHTRLLSGLYVALLCFAIADLGVSGYSLALLRPSRTMLILPRESDRFVYLPVLRKIVPSLTVGLHGGLPFMPFLPGPVVRNHDLDLDFPSFTSGDACEVKGQAVREAVTLLTKDRLLLKNIGDVVAERTGEMSFLACPLVTENWRFYRRRPPAEEDVKTCLPARACRLAEDVLDHVCSTLPRGCMVTRYLVKLCPLLNSSPCEVTVTEPGGLPAPETNAAEVGQTTPTTNQGTESTHKETTHAATTPTETAPTETTPIETTPTETTPIETTPIETTPTETSPSTATSTETIVTETTPPATTSTWSPFVLDLTV